MNSDYDKYITNEPVPKAEWCISCNTKQDCGTDTDKGFVCDDCEGGE